MAAQQEKPSRWRFGLAGLLAAGPLAAIVIAAVAGAFGPAVRIAVVVLAAMAVLALAAIVADLIEYGRRKKNDDQV